ncbi:hypothetical protein PI124_g1138 [Phytophthora idaei]|nr:hypothetical protein PI125_g386 [Phytophthora idaei]KAG3167899.1 hypothetical protein PI126_g3609 [Phytophthora idaei]KAG3254297.1 hypothetical protein PI124_g1138 [Phytophthora idaei]
MDADRAPPSGSNTGSRYSNLLVRYDLYDCCGVYNPLGDDEMRCWFACRRSTRGKDVTVTHTVTQSSLDKAWTSFEERWNEEIGAVIRETI